MLICRLIVPFKNGPETLSFACPLPSLRQELTEKHLWETLGLTTGQYYLTKSRLNDEVYEASVRFRLLGGKGGFGSQLRAQGTRMSSKKRAGGYEACRDLSGRRLRSIKEAQLISEHLAKKPEQERKRQAEIRARMERLIEMAERKPVFKDVAYVRQTQDLVDEAELAVHDAILGKDSQVPVADNNLTTLRRQDKGKEKILQELQDELGL